MHASASENAELFWGLRGGGGNFGVVTSFEYQLHEVGPTVLSGLVFYPAEEAAQVLAGYRAACAAAPDELTTLVNLTTAPPVPFLPEAVHGTPIIGVGGCWSGDPAAGESGHRAVPFTGHRDRRRVRGQPLRGMAAGPGPALPARDPQLLPVGVPARGRRPGAARTGRSRSRRCPTRWPRSTSSTSAAPWDESPRRTRRTRFRDQEFIVNVIARTPDADGFAESVAWARGVAAAIGPDAGTYVNFAGDSDPSMVQASYRPETYPRLVELKNKYDPTNLFRLNQNILPTQ